jgi:hypothetical protein
MSYITEIKLKINLGRNTPESLIEWLNKCIENNHDAPYEKNPFFDTQRWYQMFATMGYGGYDKPYVKEVKNGWELAIHTDINYESEELNTFIDWIAPHVLGRKKKVYFGWFERDGDTERTNVYLHR